MNSEIFVWFCRSLSENTRLAEIVEAVAVLEQAFIKDTGITSEAVGWSWDLKMCLC